MESIDKPRPIGSSSSLTEMEEEVREQIPRLKRFGVELRKTTDYLKLDPSDLVFVGSGDSYASSLLAQSLSEGLSHAADPVELAQTPKVCKDKTVYITSVTGKTKGNILLAKRIKRIAKLRVAITANPESQLARECDETLNIRYERKRILTPGTLSFTLCLLAIVSRIKQLPRLEGLERVYLRARDWAKPERISPASSFLFVGSGLGYGLSAYGAFKIHEVLGKPADYDHTEQLGHSKLFSLSKNQNIIFVADSNDHKAVAVSRSLKANGFNSHILVSNFRDPIIAALELAFSIQHMVLGLARKARIKEVAFLKDQERLALSTRLIY